MSKASRREKPFGKAPKIAAKFQSQFGPANSKARIKAQVTK